jgi:hypothetical protein
MSARETTAGPIAAAEAILKFVEDNNIETLNVARPRASGWVAGYAFAIKIVAEVIRRSPE